MRAPSPGRYQGYLAGRFAVLGVLLAVAAAFQARRGGSPVPFSWFFGITGLSFGITLLSLAPLRLRKSLALWARIQPAWDVAYATALVFLSGGAFSPFVTLYPLVIVGAALLLQRRGALVAATASSLAYGLLVDLQYYGWLRPLNPFPLPEVDGEKLLFQLALSIVGFFAVALLAGYLAEELRRTGKRLEEAEAEVLDLEHLKDLILEGLGSGLVALDRAGRVRFHNRAAQDLLGRAGVPLAPGADLTPVFDLAGGSRNEVTLEGGLVLGYSVSPLTDRDDRPIGHLVIFQDLTRVKRMEEDLRRADRLAAVGRLAAGLAHEIRNPLGSLAGSVEVLRQSLRPEGDDAALFEIVLRETGRLNRLVANFLLYARPGRAEPRSVAFRDLVGEVGFFFAQGEGNEAFRLENRVPEGFRIEADPAQWEQVLLNLFRNAVEAAPRGVTVTVEAGEEAGTPWIRVADDGPGMPPDVAARAFEPFQSGKPGGTGLGLATVHRIAENHGATVELDTAPGRGTRFTFRFGTAHGHRSPVSTDRAKPDDRRSSSLRDPRP
ncbi:sensor histidine kinase [Deferrisoma palaeochoriense]